MSSRGQYVTRFAGHGSEAKRLQPHIRICNNNMKKQPGHFRAASDLGAKKFGNLNSQYRATQYIMQGLSVDVNVNLINRGSPVRRCFGDARMQGRPRVRGGGNCLLSKPCAQHLLLSDVLLLLPTRFQPHKTLEFKNLLKQLPASFALYIPNNSRPNQSTRRRPEDASLENGPYPSFIFI